jgi:hypothetical protein
MDSSHHYLFIYVYFICWRFQSCPSKAKKTTCSKKTIFSNLRKSVLSYKKPIVCCIYVMAHQPKCRQMTTSSRQSAWNLLYSCVNDGVLEYGAMAETARLFGISAISAIGMALFWRETSKKISDNNIDITCDHCY